MNCILISSFCYSSKFENGLNQTDEDSCSLDSKLESKKKATKELSKLKKSVMIKNTSAMEVQALEEVTEQTLRVHIKLLNYFFVNYKLIYEIIGYK